MSSIIYVSHTRLKNPQEPGIDFSFVWEESKDGFISEVNDHPTVFHNYSVFAPIEHYHDMPEYLKILRKVVGLDPDAIVIPFTPSGGEYEDELIEILRPYRGIIVALTAAPSEKALRRYQIYGGSSVQMKAKWANWPQKVLSLSISRNMSASQTTNHFIRDTEKGFRK
jgi:hypothetical protein